MTADDAAHPDEHPHADPLVHVDQPDHPDAIAESRARAARSIRDIGHALVGHDVPRELIDRVSSRLEELVAELAAHPVRDRASFRHSGDWGPAPADGSIMTSFDERPVSGRSSPWGLDLEVHRDGDEAVGRLTLRAAHEGAPGRSHGGIVAALFDDMFGFVLTVNEQAGFTGEIAIRYVAGTPIGKPLECRVRLDRREGRKLFMTGELTDQGTVVARSTATFIAIDPSQFRLVSG